MEFTNDTYYDILHRMTGFDIGVVEIYFKSITISNKKIGKLTIEDIYKSDTIRKLTIIEKRLKLQKLIDLSK